MLGWLHRQLDSDHHMEPVEEDTVPAAPRKVAVAVHNLEVVDCIAAAGSHTVEENGSAADIDQAEEARTLAAVEDKANALVAGTDHAEEDNQAGKILEESGSANDRSSCGQELTGWGIRISALGWGVCHLYQLLEIRYI